MNGNNSSFNLVKIKLEKSIIFKNFQDQLDPRFMKISFLSLVTFFLFAGNKTICAQVSNSSTKVFRVAVFAPMYLDSVFSMGKLKTNSLPKFMMPAVEFVQGAEIAFDTLALNGKRAEAHFFDSKSYSKPIPWLIRYKQLDNIDLIIGSVKEPDYSKLALFAKERNIPFISATYPNDGAMKQNPFTVIVNSTLKAHCEGIFSYLVQKHGSDNIFLFKKKNDNRIDDYFKATNMVDGKPLLKIRTIALDSSITSYALRNLIDTNKTTVIIGASLDETFSRKLADACYPIQKSNPLVLIGMPNWDGFQSLARKGAYTDFPIRYSTPHYNAKVNAFSDYLEDKYFEKYRSKPTDMAVKGFEAAYYFTNILLEYDKAFMQHLNENNFAVIHDFNFKPTYTSKNAIIPDYFENKHLFIMQILNGHIVREW